MIAEDLKKRIDGLSKDQRHEVSVYLTKLQLENDPEYWRTIRERSNCELSTNWVNADDI